MKTSKMNQLKQSEICRIKAAILEIMEEVNFIVTEDVKFKPALKSEYYMMSFQKKSTSVGELNNIQNELGDDFNVIVDPCDKNSIVVTIVAHEDAFICKLGKKPQFLSEQKSESYQEEELEVNHDINYDL